MLEHLPRWLGKAMAGLRAGADKLVIVQTGLAEGAATLDLASPAFANEARLPPRFTADGDGISPPLVWGEAPPGTASLALIVEDADSPSPTPLVHAVIWGLAADSARLAEGAIVADGAGRGEGGDVGRSSFFTEGWLPPDPPAGHGTHRYAFQLFALDNGAGDPGTNPGRGQLVKAMQGHVVGAGLLIGTYSRGDGPKPRRSQATLAPA